MKIERVVYMIGYTGDWRESINGDHVPLPLDASAVPDAVVEQMLAMLFPYRHTVRGDYDLRVREAIAALAAALGEEG
jgi:hypothetical protein